MDELGPIAHLAMKNEWRWHGEKEDEEGREKENREKRNSSREFLEEDRACKNRRGQKPQETGHEEARSGGFGSSSGDRFRPSPARHRLGRSKSAALTLSVIKMPSMHLWLGARRCSAAVTPLPAGRHDSASEMQATRVRPSRVRSPSCS